MKLSNGSNVFDLKFAQSTVKVAVTDYFYMLDYAIIRGVNFICFENSIGKLNFISIF